MSDDLYDADDIDWPATAATLQAEVATLRADRDRYRDVAQAAEALSRRWNWLLSSARLSMDTNLIYLLDALAAAVRALGEKP